MIIGLTGLAGSGKSEVANVLRELGEFRRVAFADPLKSMLAAVGFTHAQLYGDEKATPIPELGGVTPRHAMQQLGTEWGRNLIHPEIWITLWKKQAEGMLERAHHVVADDVRFSNEVAAIKALGGQVWRIVRPGIETMGHASETEIANLEADCVIHNNANLHQLRMAAIGLMGMASRA